MGQDTVSANFSGGRDRQADRPAVSPFGVLLVGNFLSTARPGSCTVCELLAGRLSSAGWSVLTTSNKSARLSRLADMLITVWRRRRDYAVAQVDVYSGPSFIWAESVCWLLESLGKPFILTLHGGNLPAFGKRWPRRVRRLLNSASVVTTPSRYLQEALSAYRKDLLRLPNGLDLERYTFRLRQDPTPSLVWLRAFCEIYSPSLAVHVLARVLRAFPEARLSMFGPDTGDGSLQRLKSEIQKLKLGEQVHLEGAVAKKEVPKALNAGDIFLNTTNVDNTPVSVIEAMASGLCVVSTNVGGMPYLVQEEVDGLLVPPNDVGAMVNAVKRVLGERDLASRLSQNARAKAEQFDWSTVLPQWLTLLDGLGSGKKTNLTSACSSHIPFP